MTTTTAARRIATETLKTEQRAKMAQLVAEQKAARAALRERQRSERAAQMAEQKAERAALRDESREEMVALRAVFQAPKTPTAEAVEAEDFEIELGSAPEMPMCLTAALYRLCAEGLVGRLAA